jgi:hypothetical protein
MEETMSGMEAKLLAKLVAIEQVMYEVMTDEQRQEFATRVAWRMLEWDSEDILAGTIWEEIQ